MMSRLTVSCFISTVVKLRPLGSSHFERWLGRGTYLPYWLLNNHTMCNAVTYCNCQNTAHRFGCFMKCYCFVETSVLRKRRVEVPQKNAMLVDCTTWWPLLLFATGSMQLVQYTSGNASTHMNKHDNHGLFSESLCGSSGNSRLTGAFILGRLLIIPGTTSKGGGIRSIVKTELLPSMCLWSRSTSNLPRYQGRVTVCHAWQMSRACMCFLTCLFWQICERRAHNRFGWRCVFFRIACMYAWESETDSERGCVDVWLHARAWCNLTGTTHVWHAWKLSVKWARHDCPRLWA